MDKYYGFLIITYVNEKSNTFTFENKCVTMNNVFKDEYTYSSGDRAPPSGGGCGGSNPPRCVFSVFTEKSTDRVLRQAFYLHKE